MVRTIGTVNGYSVSSARIGRKSFMFDGTTRGLVTSSLAQGAKAGTIVEANFGGGFRDYEIVAAPWDGRCNGYWAQTR